MWSENNNKAQVDNKCTEVELEIIKMTNVTRDIRIVIENILEAKDLDKRVDEELLENFSIELRSILENLRFFSTNKTQLHSLKVSEKIQQCREEDEHSENTGGVFRKGSNYHLQNSYIMKDQGRDSLQIGELYEANQGLIDENEFLTKKLEQAETYIKKMEYQNNLLLSDISTLKNQQKSNIKPYTENLDDRQSLHIQNQDLRLQLHQTKQFIMRNNQQFVRQLQKYNQKIWRLQRDNEDFKNKLSLSLGKSQQSQLLISKLRQQNFQLQVLARNMKNLIAQQDRKDNSMRDYSQGQDSDRMRTTQNGKLKDFFKERIQESLRRKDTD